MIVEESKVREATGATWERWVSAAESEHVDNFLRMNAFTETTPEELAEIGGQSKVLPMKCVWSIKPGDLYKCRAVVCGNYADKDPSEEVYTAQAETASVMLGLKYGQVREWETWKLDVKSAFLNAPLPEELLVVVRPPRAWVRMGIVKANALWTCRKAVYGLRVSPRAWGIERDMRLRELPIKVGEQQYHLKQSRMDSQVWMVTEKNPKKGKFTVLGLIICYVDDMLCIMEDGKVKEALFKALRSLWTMSTEVKLEKGQKILFLGLELERTMDGTLEIHQESFVRMILIKHGLDETSKSLSTVVMSHPTDKDLPPDSSTLKRIQGMAGEFNWLATRTRADLGYWTSLISSAATKHGAWSLELGKKVLRYLLGKQSVRIRFPRGGCSASLIAWTDAGYGGISTRSQSGVIISWAGSIVLWRSSKQRTAAQSTCEAEVSAAALGFQIVEGLRAILEEWSVTLSKPLLLVDNKSALVLATCGGSWRTRYFAVRAARIADEAECGRLDLRYCRTGSMLADSLTKLASAEILERLLGALRGELPDVPGADQAVTASDATWWASLVMCTAGSSGDQGSGHGSGNDQGGGDNDPPPSTSLRADDGRIVSTSSATAGNQTETANTDDKKKRRGKPQKKLTGNQREKRRREQERENWGDQSSFEPDWT